MTIAQTPDTTISRDDPGDDTARRYAYQWTYAAIRACALLDVTVDIVEVFCEHHEDVLLKHRDNAFTGIQVKTRETGGDPWTATEDQIFAACCRFASLENDFPGSFREFVLATNHTFLSNRKTGTCLPYLLELSKAAADEVSADPKLLAHLKKLNRKTGHPKSVCLAAMKKCRCDHSLPKIDHIKQELVNTLAASWDDAANVALPALQQAANALVSECQRASSLDHAQTLPRYITANSTIDSASVREAIQGKRLSAERVQRSLNSSLTSASMLASGTPPRPEIGIAGRTKLDIKLEAGGFSAVSINAAKDLRDKAEFHSLEWMHQFGEREGLRRHDHVRSIALRDAADAFEQSKSTALPFGIAMRDALKAHFQKRRRESTTPLFECLDEHLEGHVYSLTKECKVWWSEPFAIPESN